ncbi:FEL protein, partial [Amia calva]|nr:FEL protein [Amia calva]
ALRCHPIPGILKQIDAGAGRVCGIDHRDQVVDFNGDAWVSLQATGKHVSVGPAGMWRVGLGDLVFKWLGSGWVRVNPGRLHQIDAGGDKFVVGCNASQGIFCLNRRPVLAYESPGSVPWRQVPGLLNYYSCGPFGCWGVNKLGHIFVKMGVSGNFCQGPRKWYRIPGSLSMVEVGTDGSVHGVNWKGLVFWRAGINACNNFGSRWLPIKAVGRSRHVSYDRGILWVVCENGRVQRCTV